MHESFYQIALAVFCLGVITERTLRFFRREYTQSLIKYISIIVIWGTIALFSLFPPVTHWISIRLGLGENLNALIFIGFIVLFLLFFRMLAIVEHIETTITELIRKEALRDLQMTTKKKKS
jgi:hypothetical protein